MVKIRLTRMGDKKSPFYRIIVADSRAPRDGKVRQCGHYRKREKSARKNQSGQEKESRISAG